MGMFDYLRCHYPLSIDGANELEFQTKDTDAQYLEHYEIREDGTLWHQDYDIEDQSDPKAEGLTALIGMMTPVNQRWVPEPITGEIRFYSSLDGKWEKNSWVEFSAYFIKGKLQNLVVISGTPIIG
jgi:hypothetical protein